MLLQEADEQIAAARAAAQAREARRLATLALNPGGNVYSRGLAPTAPELRVKPWEPKMVAAPHKKWRKARLTSESLQLTLPERHSRGVPSLGCAENTFYYERAAATLLENAAPAVTAPMAPDEAAAGALLVVGKLGAYIALRRQPQKTERNTCTGTKRGWEPAEMGSLLRPLGLDAAEQVESTGSVYQRLLGQADACCVNTLCY